MPSRSRSPAPLGALRTPKPVRHATVSAQNRRRRAPRRSCQAHQVPYVTQKATGGKWRKAQRQPTASELRDSANDTKHTDALSGRQNRKHDAKNWREVMPIWSGWLQPPMPQPKATCAIEQGREGQQTTGVRTRSLHRKTTRLRGIFPRHVARFRPTHLERFFRGYHLP